MTENDDSHNPIDYIEISVLDLKAAQAFYSKAFGWTFTDYAPNYCGIKKRGGGEMGGLSVETQVSTGGPLVVLSSNQIEACLERVIAAGGIIVKDIFEFPGGRRFEFLDPSQNKLAVWSQ